jgi:predicted short-subunit dehydrogenase-like oxidoreductase (DUF2520 family)
MKTVIIGNGNVAYHLVPALVRQGHEVLQVLNSKDNLQQINRNADIYFLLVPDNALPLIADGLRLPSDKIVVHVSGTTPLSTIRNISENTGVMYFLQTFSKNTEIINLQNVPVCAEASNPFTEKMLLEIANSLSERVLLVNSKQRAKIHLAAVFANNFTNVLYGVAEEILKDEKLPLSLLLPLIEQTVEKIKTMPPAEAQTGPAKREDTKTIEKHLQMLDGQPQLQELYRQLTYKARAVKVI